MCGASSVSMQMQFLPIFQTVRIQLIPILAQAPLLLL